MQENTLSASTPAVSDEESAEVNANDQPEAPKQVLQYLFSLIRGEVEQLDSRALPLCLHQVLPTNPPRPASPQSWAWGLESLDRQFFVIDSSQPVTGERAQDVILGQWLVGTLAYGYWWPHIGLQ